MLENDNTVLIKGLKKVVNVRILKKHASYRNVLLKWIEIREITFQYNRENLAKAGVFRWVTNIHEHKRYYYTFVDHYYLLRAFRTHHKSFHAKS